MSIFSQNVHSPHPDILELIADFRDSSTLKVCKAVVPFGVTDTEIVLLGEVPIGTVSGPATHYPHIGPLSQGTEIIRLAPAVRSSEPFPLLRREAFQRALEDLLGSGLSAWNLICEQDCDQHP
ncbi:MAG: hypothetical protein EOP86_21255, partial [Verrucomicrobiaceae bacterium]